MGEALVTTVLSNIGTNIDHIIVLVLLFSRTGHSKGEYISIISGVWRRQLRYIHSSICLESTGHSWFLTLFVYYALLVLMLGTAYKISEVRLWDGCSASLFPLQNIYIKGKKL